MYEREIRSLLLSLNGSSFTYHKNDSSEAENCKLLVQNSQRTAYVVCGDGQILLAHIDQLRPTIEEDSDTELSEDNGQQMNSDSGGRYPTRVRCPPMWLKEYASYAQNNAAPGICENLGKIGNLK